MSRILYHKSRKKSRIVVQSEPWRLILPFEKVVGVELRCLNRRTRLRFVPLGPPSTLDTDSTHTQTIVTIRSTLS